jgi:hypothetical protein
VLAVLVGVGAAWLAWTQARRAAAPTGSDPAALTLALKRLPAGERLAELRRRAAPGTWEHELAVEAIAATDEAARVGVVNLALAEAEHALTRGAGWPRAAVRIALLGAALLAFAAYIGGSGGVKAPLAILGIGGIAALTCVEARRSAQRNATRQRRAIDELVAATLGETVRAADAASCRTAPAARGRPAGPERRQRRRGFGAGS